MKFVLLFFLFSVAAGSRLLLEEDSNDQETGFDTEVKRISVVKGLPRKICRCACDVAHKVWKFSKKCYGKVKRFCCSESPKVGWQPRRQEEERMDFNTGNQRAPDNKDDNIV